MPPELKINWTVRITPEAAADRYKIVRGEAANLTQALSLLYRGHPSVSAAYADNTIPNTYEYTYAGYRIIYEALEEKRIMRVLFFTLATQSME